MMRARRKCRAIIVVAGLSFGFSLQLAFFSSGQAPVTSSETEKDVFQDSGSVQKPSNNAISAKEKFPIHSILDEVTLGKEYAGKVVKVNPLSVDAMFELENRDTRFPGNLHIEDMRLDTKIRTAAEEYALGDMVTACAWKFQRGRIRMSKKIPPGFNLQAAELGKEYTGTVVKVNDLSIDAHFETGDASFVGNLHLADMGSENRIPKAGDEYTLGDKVTARAWKLQLQRERVKMSKDNSRFENRKNPNAFSVGDVVTGRFLNRGGPRSRFAFFDVGAFVDGALDTEKDDIGVDVGSLANGDSMTLKVEKVVDGKIIELGI